MSLPALYPCFLGPYGENDALLESLLVEFLRDHVYWRRNLHPEDLPAIPTGANRRPDYVEFESRLRRELHLLSAALKRSVPFHSPRYLGHMVSDLLIPGLAAQVLALPYNPNNVSADAAPITIDLELKAGLQLAAMLGWPADPAREDCAFGHLTSGGTLANLQGLRLALALKAFPVALRAASVPLPELPGDDWEAFNTGPSAATALFARWCAWRDALPSRERQAWQRRVDAQRIETLGLAGFFEHHPQLSTPRVFAPATAHYSWSKGMKMLGLGRAQLELIPGRAMRLDVDALEEALDGCLRRRQPVLMAVGVLGSTEFGTIDPLDGLADVRERMQARGLGLSLHLDAAWGGYLASLFRNADGSLRSRDDVGAGFRDFPQPQVHAAFAAIPRMDSVTIDPHKLGYLPYGSGAFLCRDQRAIGLLAEDADYVFDGAQTNDYFQRHRQLGRYIPEGSKPGANAAAVYVTHRVLPLDHANFGQLPAQGLHATEAFVEAAQAFIERIAPLATAVVPFAPDCNLVCLAMNPHGNRDVAAMNRFMRRLHDALRADPGQPLQRGEYFGSMTTLRPDAMGAADTARVLQALRLAPDALDDGGDDRDRIVVLRHTLMNPFLLDEGGAGGGYIRGYFDHLERLVASALAAGAGG
ncbi:MAG TPA: pyridoxal-dependent decarboxylase [Luteimonas sp.]|nr:pyridoxal-dependent decarboxylase [Luteimonas sp.]HRP71655.1 pyridoxal-dependent decarboxylase [Luteimonas sp.]